MPRRNALGLLLVLLCLSGCGAGGGTAPKIGFVGTWEGTLDMGTLGYNTSARFTVLADHTLAGQYAVTDGTSTRIAAMTGTVDDNGHMVGQMAFQDQPLPWPFTFDATLSGTQLMVGKGILTNPLQPASSIEIVGNFVHRFGS